MLQILDVPDDVHKILKARAAREGLSLSKFIKRELQLAAARPSMQERPERTSLVKPILLRESPAEIIRQLRGSK